MSGHAPIERIQVDSSDEGSQYDTRSIIGSNLTQASTVQDYFYENGRRYHAYRHGQYPIPNDEVEQDRLDFLHYFFRLLVGGALFRAPVAQPQPPRRILDIGTGTGIWAVEVADIFPDAKVIGIDLSPIQVAYVPTNCSFFVDDAESEWAYPREEAFDYIHARNIAGGIADWPRLLRQIYANLEPGGWVELQEHEMMLTSDDDTHGRAPTVMDWQERLNDASRQFGKLMNVASRLAGMLTEAGFESVVDDVYKSPIGPWAKDPHLKEIGKAGMMSMLEGIEPYSLALFTRVLGYTYEETREYTSKVQDELLTSRHHLYGRVHYIYGRRPLES